MEPQFPSGGGDTSTPKAADAVAAFMEPQSPSDNLDPSSANATDAAPTFPEELVEHILSILVADSPASLLRAERVCRAFRRIGRAVLRRAVESGGLIEPLLLTGVVFDQQPNQVAQRVVWNPVAGGQGDAVLFRPAYTCFLRLSNVAVVSALPDPCVKSTGTDLSHIPTGLVVRLVDDGKLMVSFHASWVAAYESARRRPWEGAEIPFALRVPLAHWAQDERRRFAGLPEGTDATLTGNVNMDQRSGETTVRVKELGLPLAAVARKLAIEEAELEKQGGRKTASHFSEAVRMFHVAQAGKVARDAPGQPAEVQQ
ncbi:hypothetical protein DFJ74DRAFT_708779 [Hyaloraphidium curvatum]|nr:hypothetical protein DFJ74DRAFT_708779 [Hyaloraphidium curvatum]